MSKQAKPIDELRYTLEQMKGQFKLALPPHVSVDKFVRIVQTAIITNQALLDCNRTTLLAACMKAAQSGLYPNGSESAIIPFKGRAQFIPMVEGILKLIRNSGEISTITSQVIYERDEFSYYVDLDGEHILFKPDFLKDRGSPIGVFALAKTKEGDFYFEVLTKLDVEKIQASSPSNNGPWKGDFFLEMWRKSAIKRLSKRLPKSTDIENVIEADNQVDKVMLKDTKQEIILEETQLEEPQQQQQLVDTSCNVNNIEASLVENKETPTPEPVEAPKPKKKRIEDFLEGKSMGAPLGGREE